MPSRREFLSLSAGAGIAGCFAAPQLLLPISPLTAAQAKVTPDLVELKPEIEPIVRLIENTPREKCFEMMVDQLKQGLPYRNFLAALFLAGIRNVNPQPPGFKFHCVFVIHAAHQASLDAPAQDRLLPLFWALDSFKDAQQQDIREGDFHLKPFRGGMPSESQAWKSFHDAMDNWDEQGADAAMMTLVLTRSSHEIIAGLWRYGARDYRNIGHKAIFVANTWRTLQTIGWRHAEPALRSLVLGLLDFGRDERVNNYAFEDQSYAGNLEVARSIVKTVRPEWSLRFNGPLGKENQAATGELLAEIRKGDAASATAVVVRQLTTGHPVAFQAQSAWDAVHLAAGELMMRQPGIFGIHTVTSAHALRYAFETAGDPETRLLMLLQAIGWMCQFTNFMSTTRGGLKSVEEVEIQPAKLAGTPAEAIEEVLSLVGKQPAEAAAKAHAFAHRYEGTPAVDQFARSAYQLIFRKGTDAHDYKYSTSIFGDLSLVSPHVRPHMLAAAAYNLRGSTQADSAVMQRARDAIARL